MDAGKHRRKPKNSPRRHGGHGENIKFFSPCAPCLRGEKILAQILNSDLHVMEETKAGGSGPFNTFPFHFQNQPCARLNIRRLLEHDQAGWSVFYGAPETKPE